MHASRRAFVSFFLRSSSRSPASACIPSSIVDEADSCVRARPSRILRNWQDVFEEPNLKRTAHRYYFSASLLPTLFVPLLLPDFLPPLSPLLFQYNFVLLVISTTGGHSGFEDHWQSKQYHYLHHAKFECNYGDHFTAWIDMYMGTFREKLGESREYAGEWAEEKEQVRIVVGIGGADSRSHVAELTIIWSCWTDVEKVCCCVEIILYCHSRSSTSILWKEPSAQCHANEDKTHDRSTYEMFAPRTIRGLHWREPHNLHIFSYFQSQF